MKTFVCEHHLTFPCLQEATKSFAVWGQFSIIPRFETMVYSWRHDCKLYELQLIGN